MLNIKDPEAHSLAKELAERRGISMTRAVVEALRHDLDRARGEGDTEKAARKEALRAFLQTIWSNHPAGGKTLAEIDDEIYDEHGLPR